MHEAYPGHLLEGAWRQQLAGVPEFRYEYVPSYSEGWGMYSETLGPELGLYREPMTRLGLLAGQLDRALRLVVETGIHLHGWSREDALAFLRERGMEPEDVNQLAVDRFTAVPGLLTAHLVGLQTFVRLRREAEAALGARFDLRAFHLAVLEHGSLPLAVLEERVRAWMARGTAVDAPPNPARF